MLPDPEYFEECIQQAFAELQSASQSYLQEDS